MVSFDFVRHRRWFYGLSFLILAPGLLSLLLPGGVNLGIDFTSGTIMTLRVDQAVDPPTLRDAFAEAGHPEALVQRSSDGVYIVRMGPLEQAPGDLGSAPAQTARDALVATLAARVGPVEVLSLDFVSPVIAAEIVQHAVLAVLAACVGILLYLWWAFRRVRNPVRFGACAVAALAHDAMGLLGIFSILGRVAHVELDAMFITAMLTVIGFSVHDTIVVFDRIRENSVRHAGEPFDDIVNHSLIQTLGRSVSTSITILLTMTALFLYGGAPIRTFALAILIGIGLGTYSSIFNASLLLSSWEHGDLTAAWRGARPWPAPRQGRASVQGNRAGKLATDKEGGSRWSSPSRGSASS